MMLDDIWTAPPVREDDCCLSIVSRIAGPGTLADGDTFIASDGTHWRRIHSQLDAMTTSPAAPRRYLVNGRLCRRP